MCVLTANYVTEVILNSMYYTSAIFHVLIKYWKAAIKQSFDSITMQAECPHVLMNFVLSSYMQNELETKRKRQVFGIYWFISTLCCYYLDHDLINGLAWINWASHCPFTRERAWKN